MTELTAEKVRLVMLAIAAKRLRGEIAQGKPVSTEHMARISQELGVPLDEKTFRNAERRSIARASQHAKALLALQALHSQF